MACTLPTSRTKIRAVVSTIIDSMRENGTIDSIVDNGDGTATITTTSTGSVQANDTIGENPFITIGGNDYAVKSLVADTSFTVRFTGSVPSGTEWKAKAPYLYFGNPIEMSNEIDRETNANAKYPAVIVFEDGTSTQPLDEESPIDTVESLQMFFMDIANYSDWVIDEFYENVIDRMEELSFDFVQACRDYQHTEELEGNATRQRVSKWGVSVVRTSGNSQDTIFNDKLSGVSLNLDLPISKSLNYECV